MDGRVVEADADVVRFHFFHELGTGDALRQHDLEQVPVGALKILWWQLRAGLRFEILAQRREIMVRQFAPLRGDGVQLRKLPQPNRGGDVGHVVFAAQHVHVDAVPAATRDALQPVFFRELCFLFIIQHQTAAFGGGDVLVGLKTERNEIAEGADGLSFPCRTDGLRGIFDHAQLVLGRDRIQPVHIHRLARQIHRDNGLGALGYRGFDLIQIDVARDRVDVGEHRCGADFEYHVCGGDPGDRRGDDFIACAYARDAQRDLHGAGAGVEGAHRATAEIEGKLLLEFLHPGSAGDPAGTQHLRHRGDGGFVYGGFGKR